MEEIEYRVNFDPKVLETDIPSLHKSALRIIKEAIEKRLRTHPDKYGKPLVRNLTGFRRLRVSNYRIIYKIHPKEKEVLIIAIDHRKDVYED